MGQAMAEKKVDESWKDSVQKEKAVSPGPEGPFAPEPTFSVFVSTIGMQALAAMGEIPDPVSREKKTDLLHAKYLIDVIEMLRAKTQGRLSQEEESMLRNLLYELQMKFVAKSQNA